MWVPDEGRHTGTPSLPTYGVPSLTPAFDATIYNFPVNQMTTGRMTCAFGADDVFLLPFRKLRFQMIDNRSLHMIAIDRIPLQHSIVGNQAMSTLGQEDLVAEFHRLQCLAPLD